MNTTDALRFVYADAPAPGEIREVAPGVGWLRMPMPGVLNHINLWILRGDDGVTLVDTGLGTEQSRAVWEDVFAGPLHGETVRRVFCTHHHPDHMGLCGWLTERTGAPLFVTKPEYAAGTRWRSVATLEAERLSTATYRRAGLDLGLDLARIFAEGRDRARAIYGEIPAVAEFVDPTQPLVIAGTSWRLVVGRGHSPELVALYAPDLEVLISSDQVLPQISPNVGVIPEEPDANPLGEYLDSLRRFRQLPAETLVLPSHKQLFYGLHTRIDDLTMHHMTRLDAAREICARGGTTARHVLAALFPRRLEPSRIFPALGETLAHLNFLVEAGEIARDRSGDVDVYSAR